MRRRFILAVSILGGAMVASVVACTSDDSNVPLNAVKDSGTSPVDSTVPVADTSTAPDTSVADAADAAPPPDVIDAAKFSGCNAFDFADADYTGPDASRVIYFPDGSSPFFPDGAIDNYTPHCMAIKVGQQVTWVGDFFHHNLGPYGNDNNPIPNGVGSDPDSGLDGSFAVAFPEAGWFGYQCQQHGVMFGAISVSP